MNTMYAQYTYLQKTVSTLSNSRSTFTLSGKLFGEDGLGPFKRMRYAEDSEITQRRRVSCFIVVL